MDRHIRFRYRKANVDNWKKRIPALLILLLTAASLAGCRYRDTFFASREGSLPGGEEGIDEPFAPGLGDVPAESDGIAGGDYPGEGEPPGADHPSRYPPPPGEILHIADGDYLLALVTKQTTLGRYAPADLVPIPAEMAYDARDYYRLRREAYLHLRKMWEAARADGVEFYVISAYRCYATQERLFHDYAARHGEEKANRFSARPGQSEHQLGTAVDFAVPGYYLTPRFADTAAGRWLAENAYKFGFVMSYPEDTEEITGYIYEPWHYRYIGVEFAAAWKESGLVLSQFLQRQPQFWRD